MIKINKQRLYPNPFRYRNLKTTINKDEIFEEVNENLQPFLSDKFSLIQNYIDEFGDLRSEIKLIRILRRKIRNNFEIIKNKTDFLSRPFLQEIDKLNSVENYYKNLRYLELPVQPRTNKKGFEFQFLSEELIEDAIEEIEDGFSYVYEYCSDFFPESTELWSDYALLYPDQFPFISHDSMLDSTYEVFDKIFADIQKNSLNLFNWAISGDLNTRLLKIVKPHVSAKKINYLFTILESLLSLTLFLLIIKYLISYFKPIIVVKSKKLTINDIKSHLEIMKNDFKINKLVLQQKTNKIKLKILNIKSTYKYKILKTIIGKPY